MSFSKDNLNTLQKGYGEVSGKCLQLMNDYLVHNYKEEEARKYAQQGFLRRFKTLARCIENTFELIPPDRDSFPSVEELTDTVINIQAFVFNAFGSIDNLAWIWVSEKNVTKANDSPLARTSVGFGKKCKVVRDSLSDEFIKHFDGLEVWFKHLVGFRDALAHRIPLYIPPYIVSPDDEATYQALAEQMSEAMRQGDFAERDRLSTEQAALCVFRPFMLHDLKESAHRVSFHPQLLADFNTIEELGRKMLDELRR